MLAKIENGVVTQWPLGEHFLSAAHPNTSFSYPPSDAVLAHFGYARFVYSDPAPYDSEFQEPKELPPSLNGIVATQRWEIVEKYTPQEKAEYLAAKAAAAKIQALE